MADRPASSTATPTPTADQRRIAQDSFTKAREAIAGDQLDYAIALLLTCCRLDPGNFLYRQTLRKTQKDKFGNNLRGSRFAFLTTPRWKARVKSAKRGRDYLKVLEHAEQVLVPQPVGHGHAARHGRGVRRPGADRPRRLHARPGPAEVPEGRDAQPGPGPAVREARRLPEGHRPLAAGEGEAPDRRGGRAQGQGPGGQRDHPEGPVR